ncbi:hypothetical protein LV779_36935 [Streptomyces thinghirensis]|nr:hypothetical protein [Streptomyces thinghirensis]
MLVKPGPDPSHLASQRRALLYAYLERNRHRGVHRAAVLRRDAQKFGGCRGGAAFQDGRAAYGQARKPRPRTRTGAAAGQPDDDDLERGPAGLDGNPSAPGRPAEQGITPENWWAGRNTLKLRRLPEDRVGSRRDKAVVRGVHDRRRRRAGRLHHGCRVVIALLAAVHPGRHGGPPDEPLHAPAAQRRLRHRRAAPSPMLVDQLSGTDPTAGSTPGCSRSRITSTDEIGKSPAPSTR